MALPPDSDPYAELVDQENERAEDLVEEFTTLAAGCCDASGLVLAHDQAARRWLLQRTPADLALLAAYFLSLESQLRDHTGHTLLELASETLDAHRTPPSEDPLHGWD